MTTGATSSPETLGTCIDWSKTECKRSPLGQMCLLFVNNNKYLKEKYGDGYKEIFDSLELRNLFCQGCPAIVEERVAEWTRLGH